jgi:hypothetical protein
MTKEPETEVIRLTLGKDGISRKYGTDENGNVWIEFEVDYFAEQTPGECSVCGAELESGWLCMDGGEEVCEDHVDIL